MMISIAILVYHRVPVEHPMIERYSNGMFSMPIGAELHEPSLTQNDEQPMLRKMMINPSFGVYCLQSQMGMVKNSQIQYDGAATRPYMHSSIDQLI